MRSIVLLFFTRFIPSGLVRKRGQTLVEYALILALIGIVMIAVMSMLGTRVVQLFSAITTLLDTAQTSH